MESSSNSRSSADQQPRHFVFVHGACHGAWCWYKTVSLLQLSGHRATALDLPSSGRDNTDPAAVSTLALLSQPVVEFFQALPDNEKVILIAHSIGGIVLTYIMELFPHKLQAAVFLTAFMLPSGSDGPPEVNVAVKLASLPGEILQSKGPGLVRTPRSFLIPPTLYGFFYNLSPPEDVALADSLLKPFPELPPLEMATPHTRDKYGSVPRVFIKCHNDGAITPEVVDLYIESNPPTQVIHLDSDHSPFFSDTDGLHRSLLSVAATYAGN